MKWGAFFIFFATWNAHAEYRVFALKVSSPDQQDVRQINSTLDPIQYPVYYHIKPGYQVTYTDTWMCKGRTGHFKALCPNPRAPASEESPDKP